LSQNEEQHSIRQFLLISSQMRKAKEKKKEEQKKASNARPLARVFVS